MAPLEAFREEVVRRFGWRLETDRMAELATVFERRLALHRCTAEAYLERIVASADEEAAIAEALAIGETYFFRQREQLAAFARLLAERGPLRVLSAGCASGEEAYTLAMIARETLGPRAPPILACDASPAALERAIAGRYGAWSLRDTPPAARARWFVAPAFTVAPEVAEGVRFERRNLAVADPSFWWPDRFDVVFCRNVLMYFEPAASHDALARIVNSLAPGGALFLGHAETMRGLARPELVDTLELCASDGGFFYRRRGRAPATGDSSWVEVIGRSSERVAALGHEAVPAPGVTVGPTSAGSGSFDQALGLLHAERFADALASLPDALEAGVLRPLLELQCGDVARAEASCRDLLARAPEDAHAHYVLGLCREHARDPDGAVAAHLTATEREPSFAMPRFHLGLLARRRRDPVAARRHLTHARRLLIDETRERLSFFGGGFSRDGLIAMCDAELAALPGGDR